jgi:hypothetical protein
MKRSGGGGLKALNLKEVKAKLSATIIGIVCHGRDFKQADYGRQAVNVCMNMRVWFSSNIGSRTLETVQKKGMFD